MSGRKQARQKSKTHPNEKGLPTINNDEIVDYVNIGTFPTDEIDKLLNAFKESNIRCSVDTIDKLKAAVRSFGWCQTQFTLFVHPADLNKAMELHGKVLQWPLRLRSDYNY